jgi:hypothetical protein
LEFSPQGTKIEITVAGKTSGKVTGQIMSTHYILMKPGGISDLDLKSIIFSSGESIFVMGKASGKIVDPTPIGRIEGNLTFQTPSQRLSFLNATKGWSEATYNMATGEYDFKVYAVK